MIWAPDQRFAEEVIEECAAFPYGDHDDLVDSTTQAIMRFRQGGLLQHPEDYIEEKTAPRKRVYY
jgi:phage terminase large subunit-like protein